jgi:hypothetical protein
MKGNDNNQRLPGQGFLNSLPKDLPFNVPAGYFEEAPSVMHQKAIESAMHERKGVDRSWIPAWVPTASLAAIAIVISTLLFLPGRNTEITGSATETAMVSNQIAAGYIVENYDIDEDLLISELKESNNSNEIENYLLDNYTETQLIEEL